MTTTAMTRSLKIYLSSIIAFIFSALCLLMPAEPDNVILTVTGNGHGAYEDFDASYCFVSVNMENKTYRTMNKPDYAILEKEADGEWVYIGKGVIPQEDHWTIMHSGDVTEAFYFSLENETVFSHGEYRITIHYTVKSLSGGSEGQASAVFTVTEE